MARWDNAHCAVQGLGHVKAEIPCQDVTYSCSKHGVNVIALADGAGSATYSKEGAECVAKYAAKLFADKFDDYFNCENGVWVKDEILDNCRSELQKCAFSLDCNIKDLASTLLVASVKKDKFILLHIGDGVIGYIKDGDVNVNVASAPENGEFANETVFVTSSKAFSTMKMLKGNLGDIKGFVLISDGSQASLYQKRTKKMAPAMAKFFDFCIGTDRQVAMEQLETVFKDTIRQYTQDDCSIALLFEKDAFGEQMPFIAKQPVFIRKSWKKTGWRKLLVKVERYTSR